MSEQLDFSADAIVIDREGVDNCFGCGLHNTHGLKLNFRHLPSGAVEVRTTLAAHFCGFDNVVHGGVQATILDEVMGVAAQLALPQDAGKAACATAEMSLRYLRPVPLDREIIARATVVHVRDRDFYVHGDIVSEIGETLTSARSRWRQARS